jgi:hypothetical protein
MKIIKKPSKIEKLIPTYFSRGFALIYDNSVFENKIVDKKLNNSQNYVLHSFLNNNILVSISNPFNSKSLTAKIRKTTTYPSIYNIVITKKMADKLELDINNPYVEVLSTRENDKFIAKEASIFDEEKKVANKAPVTSINVNDMSSSTVKIKKKEPSYIIDIAEFYFLESAEIVKIRFEKEANLKNIKIKKISKNKYKVYSGPHAYFNTVKDIYFSLNNLGFENLNIINSNK